MIYLDNAATTWPKPNTVYEAVENCLRTCNGNPGRGGHASSRTASYILYETRAALAALFHINNPNRISFTYNATDALNMALLGKLRCGDRVVTTAMEHNAIARPLRYLETTGVKVYIVPCDKQGKVDMHRMKDILKKGVQAIVMSHASNVTGTIMPIAAVGQLAKEYETCFIVDAAQTAGVEEINVETCYIDMLAFSGHKGLLGPQGTGGLYVREGVSIAPLRYGGTGSLSEFDIQPDILPDRLESGTPNTPGIAGLLRGVQFIQKVGMQNIRAKEMRLSQQLIEGLKKIEKVIVHSPESSYERTAIVAFTAEKMDNSLIAHCLDAQFNIACRAGLHCAPWAHQCIGTMQTGAIRFSPGYFNTDEEMVQTIQAVKCIMQGDEQ